ncbi:hypothetical protein BG011_007380 [Mortierella polycephala]|uniref:SDE2-like domain-containing protein n=1 Tax=Mortierella polycephala TaxID=41804 RepID=A0A9P6PQA9_9FUNG|nr:hypothetical protein BG011_007380 [Mortierella polycephala]
MEAIVSVFGSNSVAVSFPETSSPSLLDLKQHLFSLYQIPIDEQRIQTAGGLPLSPPTLPAVTDGQDATDDALILLFEDLHQNQKMSHQQQHHLKYFTLSLRMNGGKGGFGSMLRAQGGRMSSQKTTNTDACRDLSGRRIKTVNDAKKMAEYLKKAPEREKAKRENLKRKIEEKLELAERPTRKHRFEDSKFFDEAEEQVEEVKSAVAAAIKESMKATGAAASNSTNADVKGKGNAKNAVGEKKKVAVKSLSMWDDMSDYESSEAEDDDDNDDEAEEEEDDESKVPSVGSSS